MPQRRKSDGPVPLREPQFPPPDYSYAASGVRDYLANAAQILDAVITEVAEREGEPFILGTLDDLRGIKLRLQRALAILDREP